MLSDEARILRDEYKEHKQDPDATPHTIGPAHLYIRNDVVDLADWNEIVPPYPVTFTDSHPKPKNWYLDRLPPNGSGRVVRKANVPADARPDGRPPRE